jgi:hypothetical protein
MDHVLYVCFNVQLLALVVSEPLASHQIRDDQMQIQAAQH